MCGIAGILNADQKYRGVTQNMLDLLNHRGPDDQGVLENFGQRIAIGSKRLSIIDLSEKGKMPMSNVQKTLSVCHNGEIYNFKELRKQLIEKGYKFASETDTEVILHGYSEWGEDVFEKLAGMFAISIVDCQNGLAFLVRDRIGIKPLYYMNMYGSLFFSSEVKAFKAVPNFNLKDSIDMEKLNLLMGFMFLPDSESTLFKDVKKVKPGHYLKWELRTNKVTDKKFWALPEIREEVSVGFEEAVDVLDIMLKKTVAEHLVADVPSGILLSGGLDSSLIAWYAQSQAIKKVKTYTARFDHKFNESHSARDVAEYLGTDHHEIFIDTKSIVDNIENYISVFDDLGTLDGGVISTSILCHELKKQGVAVVLLGEGADEIFGGYSWFGLSQLPFSVLPSCLRSAAYYYAISRNISYNPSKYYSYWHSVLESNNNDNVFRKISAIEIETQLPNHLLMKVDKASMSASVEARVPYLDHRVVEFAFKLPRGHKLNGRYFNPTKSNEKHVLREVAKRHLPYQVTQRKKRGFMLPMYDVLASDIKKVKAYVADSNALTRDLVGKKDVNNLLNFNCPAFIRMQREYLVWRLFLIEVWRDSL